MNKKSDNIIKIFISHKVETAEKLAMTLEEEFSIYGGDRLEFFLCEKIPGSTKWLDWIQNSIHQADIMFLLYTQGDVKDLNWCMDEVGRFQGSETRVNRPLIVLHSSNIEPPSPLKHYQSVKAELETLKTFLKDFFGTSKITQIEPYINTKFASNDRAVSQLANTICQLFEELEEEQIVEKGIQSSDFSDEINIFISHGKNKNSVEAAKVLKKQLELFGQKEHKLLIRLSDDRPDGAKWRRWIKDRIRQANIMFILCTRSEEKWEWGLHEAGIFEGLRDEQSRKLIILHSCVIEPPLRLQKYYLTVQAELENTKQFLKQFFGGSEITGISPPLSKALAESDKALNNAANEICSHFISQPPPEEKRSFLSRHLILTVEGEDALSIQNEQIPDNVQVESDSVSLGMFGLGPEPVEVGRRYWNWKDLKQKLTRPEELKCIAELAKAMRLATDQGVVGELIKAVFSPRGSGKTYGLLLHRLDILPGEVKKFHIAFIEQVTKPLVQAPDTFSTLLSCLTLGSRLQWEVCDYYLLQLKSLKSEAEIENNYQELRESIESIERESEFRQSTELHRSLSLDRLIWAFEQEDPKREKVKNNLKEQEGCKNKLNTAISSGLVDTETIKILLQNLRRLNKDLMVLVSQRYQEMLKSISEDVSQELSQ